MRLFDAERALAARTFGLMMGSTITWGLDLSTSKAKTAAVAVNWSPDEARVVAVHHPLAAPDIAPLIAANADSWWAVDVPFGWPDDFVQLMGDRHIAPLPPQSVPEESLWQQWRTRTIAQRRTDAFLTNDPRVRTRPLPVAFQLLGATAALWILIEARLTELGVPVDRAGVNGRVCETYPRAVLAAWGIRTIGKVDWPELRRNIPFLTAGPDALSALASPDVCDAVVCALSARARARDLTIRPADEEELAAARREGWIHVSVQHPSALLE